VSERSWLIRGDHDRERMLDMDRRLQPVRRAVFALLAVALLVCGPWLGWWTAVPIALGGALFRIAEGRIVRSRRPERGLFATWVGSQLVIALAVVLTGGADVATMSWLAIPMITLTARFSDRGIIAGVLLTMALLAAIAFGVDAAAVLAEPVTLVAPLALVLSTAILTVPLMRSDMHHRTEAVVDQLTGMLNRNALSARTAEIAAQSVVTGEPVAVILGDLDRFKAINDRFGHAAGDAVLRDVAACLRGGLRAFDLAYRHGGEEFLVLVPGATADQAEALAEQLRLAVEARPLGGHAVTMSFGVAASEPGEPFVWERAFAEADACLYAAKHAGRNRVGGAGSPFSLAAG
jgi:diguanylate cyclase (GGDEF)-like protein